MRISDWSSDVCSSDLIALQVADVAQIGGAVEPHLAIEEIGLETNLIRPDRFDVEKRIVGRDGVRQYHRGNTGSGGRGGVRPDIIATVPNTPRSEERRGGKECVSTGRSRGSRHN